MVPSQDLRKWNHFKGAPVNLSQKHYTLDLSVNLQFLPEVLVNAESVDLFMPERGSSDEDSFHYRDSD